MQEARELANESTYEYAAHPLEVIVISNLALELIINYKVAVTRTTYSSGTLQFADLKILILKKEGSWCVTLDMLIFHSTRYLH